MSDIICVTNRRLCGGDFLVQLERIAAASPKAIILREKDISPEEYRELAENVTEICRRYAVPCILHSFAEIAAGLGAKAVHLPLQRLREMPEELRRKFDIIGASCHSAEEAEEAEKLGAAYVTAGHIFATDCKKGLPPRGLDFLREVCRAVSVPVYAIGGISPENIAAVRKQGAAGGCIMSGLMRCSDPAAYLKDLEEKKCSAEIHLNSTQ